MIEVRGTWVVPLLLAAGCGDASGVGAGGGETATSSATTVAESSSSDASGAGVAGAGGAPGCGPAYGAPPSAACRACAEASCCDAMAACDADPSCGPPLRCIERCSDPGDCPPECEDASARDTPALLALVTCEAEHCGDACGLSPVPCDRYAVAPPGAPDPAQCEACLETECCDAHQALGDPEFLAYYTCKLGCSDPACLRACEAAHPEAVAAASALVECTYGTCDARCDPGPTCGVFAYSPPSCGACVNESCCELVEACSFDEACLNFHACWYGCSNEATCRPCYELWPPETVGVNLAMASCLGAECTTECADPACGLVDRLDPSGCVACLQEACCDEARACTMDAACAGLKVCVTMCEGDSGCEAACRESLPAGVAAHEALTSCRAASCSGACP